LDTLRDMKGRGKKQGTGKHFSRTHKRERPGRGGGCGSAREKKKGEGNNNGEEERKPSTEHDKKRTKGSSEVGKGVRREGVMPPTGWVIMIEMSGEDSSATLQKGRGKDRTTKGEACSAGGGGGGN